MKFRRLFALMTSAAMLHLTVVAGDAACATHGADAPRGASANAAAAPAHEMPMGDHVMSAEPGAPPCEVPTQQHCCDALLGCSVESAVMNAHEGFIASASSSVRILVALPDAPASFASAPEPPPPKA